MKTPFGGGVGVNGKKYAKHAVYVEKDVWAGEPYWSVNYVSDADDETYCYDIVAHCATEALAEAAAVQLRDTVWLRNAATKKKKASKKR